MANTTWNGLEIEGNVQYDRGVHTFSNGDPGYPESIEVEIETLSVVDEEEFALFLEENEKPSEWKTLPKECEEWIFAKWSDKISDKLTDAFFASRR